MFPYPLFHDLHLLPSSPISLPLFHPLFPRPSLPTHSHLTRHTHAHLPRGSLSHRTIEHRVVWVDERPQVDCRKGSHTLLAVRGEGEGGGDVSILSFRWEGWALGGWPGRVGAVSLHEGCLRGGYWIQDAGGSEERCTPSCMHILRTHILTCMYTHTHTNLSILSISIFLSLSPVSALLFFTSFSTFSFPSFFALTSSFLPCFPFLSNFPLSYLIYYTTGKKKNTNKSF